MAAVAASTRTPPGPRPPRDCAAVETDWFRGETARPAQKLDMFVTIVAIRPSSQGSSYFAGWYSHVREDLSGGFANRSLLRLVRRPPASLVSKRVPEKRPLFTPG